MKQIIVIPARYKSSRFPGKPLVDINGKSMLFRVWEKCNVVLPHQDIFVATDDDRIFEHCKLHNMQCKMTSSECLTGTDRIAEFAKEVFSDVYINVQGDEPLISPGDIEKVLNESRNRPEEIINAMCSIREESEFRKSSVPKVICRPDGMLLYMSRAAIPTNKNLGYVHAKKQVCVYAFPRQVLIRYATIGKKTPLEEVEDIELLRCLELGYSVRMIDVSNSSIAVDTPEDLEIVRNILLDESH